MGLQKRGSIYYAVFMIKGQRFSRTTGKTSRSAAARVEKQMRKEFLKKLARPTKATESVTKQDLRLAEAATRIHEERWKHIKSGQLQYGRMVRLAKLTGNPSLSSIDEQWIAKVKAEFAKIGKTKATINRYLAHIKTILIAARLDWKLPIELPRIRMERECGGRIRVITEEEEERILEVLRNMPNRKPQNAEQYRYFPEYAELIEFLLDTGMRLGEALNFTTGHFFSGPQTSCGTFFLSCDIYRLKPLQLKHVQRRADHV